MRFVRLLVGLLALPLAGCLDLGAAEPASEGPPCPTPVTVRANREGGVVLEWNATAGADGYNLYSPVADGPMRFMGHQNATRFVDLHPRGSEPFAYRVTATSGESESVGCAVVTYAEVPVMGDSAGLAFAAAIALAGLTLVLRKR